MDITAELIHAAEGLSRKVQALKPLPPASWVYNPLSYAWEAHRMYLRACGSTEKRILFLGMNPGPWGMAQTGVPFGEVRAVRSWMGIEAPVGRPEHEHPKRPVSGFDCPRSEVSGRRLWGLMEKRYPQAGDFFREHFVANYCPLLFFDDSGKNITPDKLPASMSADLDGMCMEHLVNVIEALRPDWLIGIGVYAAEKLETASRKSLRTCRVGKILHPSPASPRANRGWEAQAEESLISYGIWESP